jgi:hypothetical protein
LGWTQLDANSIELPGGHRHRFPPLHLSVPPGVKVAPFPDPKPSSWWIRKSPQYGEQRLELTKVEDGKFIIKTGSGQTLTWTNEWNELEDLDPRTGFPDG